jgi:hypothetical protein
MVQLSPDQSLRGPNFTAPVGGDGGYIWWYLDAVSDDGKYGLTLIAFIGSVFSPYYAWSGWKNPFNHCAINVALYRLDGAGGRWAMTERRADQLDRSAHYVCALVLVNSTDDPNPLIVEASWYGVIVDEAKGANGFGYDPHFFLPELNLTAAELNPVQKNLISHRGQALRELISQLQTRV